jgi:hypothetical protein
VEPGRGGYALYNHHQLSIHHDLSMFQVSLHMQLDPYVSISSQLDTNTASPQRLDAAYNSNTAPRLRMSSLTLHVITSSYTRHRISYTGD